MTVVVNLVAGPGTGKSTTAAATFAELKYRGIGSELVTEYAKDIVWGGTTATLGNQVYVMAKQHHRLWRLRGKVEVIVTDCPLLLSVYYGDQESDAFKQLALELFHSFDNMTWFLGRVKAFDPNGRLQTEEQARNIDTVLWALLQENNVDFDELDADRAAPTKIADAVEARVRSAT